MRAGTTSRRGLRAFVEGVGLLPAARRMRRLRRRLLERYRSERTFLEFKREYGQLLGTRLGPDRGRKIAVVSGVQLPEVMLELGLIKALELAGFTPVMLIPYPNVGTVPRYYKMAGATAHRWMDFADAPDIAAAEAIVDGCASVSDLLAFEHEGVRVGRYAVSTALRRAKVGAFDLRAARDRRYLVTQVAAGMAYAKAAGRIMETFRPELLVLQDKGYTPKGELFDRAIAAGIDTVAWSLTYKSSAVLLKRYTAENRDQHMTALAPETWERFRNLPLTEADTERMHAELYRNYASGAWFSSVGTQFDKRFPEVEEIRRRLGLQAGKKTVFIFPHVSWDATLFWGKSLFPDYTAWLVATLKAACANDAVNWVVKIHPSHVSRALRERFAGEPAEVATIRKHIGTLPPHVSMIPADSDLSTFALFPLMDYCLTVRGTVGIEAARLGIPVLTAGGGPYDHKGFTFDSESSAEYVATLARIQDIPRLSPEQRQLAERFAYGFFFVRPLPFTTMTLEYRRTLETRTGTCRFNVKSPEELASAPDLQAFARWVNSTDIDFVMPGPG